MRRAEIRLEGREADLVRRSLSPEAGRDIPGTSVTVRRTKGALVLSIEAEDTGALRAAVNSYLRWADVAVGVSREVTG